MLFSVFKEKQTAYAVVQYFGSNNILFPKRAYGGRWKGKLIWDSLSHARVLTILKHPFYAGVYTFGRYKAVKKINQHGEIISTTKLQPIEQWPVMIKDHHLQYITFDQYQGNVQQLQANRTNTPDHFLAGPPREGATLLQGLLVCGICGRRISIRYKVNKAIVPTYECNGRKRRGLTGSCCFSFRANLIDPIIEQKVIQILTPDNVTIALSAMAEIEKRNNSLNKHWEMNIQRCQYQADIAQRRFDQVDPANRLVAASLEKTWNLELEKLALAKSEYKQQQIKTDTDFPPHKRAQIASLAKEIPTLWNKTTNLKDKKRIVRLLLSDITVAKTNQNKTIALNIRWQAGPVEQIMVKMPPNAADKTRYTKATVERVRSLTLQYGDDKKTVAILNEQGILSATRKSFTRDMIQWIRFKHKMKMPVLKSDDECTVDEVRTMFNVSRHMVYYWINNKYVTARKTPANIFLIKITPKDKIQLLKRIESSCKAKYMVQPN